MTDAPTHEWQIGTEGMRVFGEGCRDSAPLFDVHGRHETWMRWGADGGSSGCDAAGRGVDGRWPRLAG